MAKEKKKMVAFDYIGSAYKLYLILYNIQYDNAYKKREYGAF